MQNIATNNETCGRIVFSSELAQIIESIIDKLKPDRTFILVDDVTKALCLHLLPEGLRNRSRTICINHGDENKNIESMLHVWRELSTHEATRHSMLFCLGGGIVTDLGGFAAATFKRGIACVNFPTTLLAMVDASIGGKTGINLDGLKNEIGCFSVPHLVVVDTQFLKTLDRPNLLSGYAEMLKHGLLSDKNMWADLLNFDICSPDLNRLSMLIERSTQVKQKIVTADPEEHGLRKALNLGHTMGHAFESFCMLKQKPILHGYAVAYGLVGELYLSHRLLGLDSRVLEQALQFIRELYGPFPITCTHVEELIELMRHDKKNRAGEINLTLLEAIGQPKLNQIPGKALITEAVDFCCDSL